MVDNALAESLVHVDSVLAQFSGLPTLKTIQNKARVQQHQLYTLIEKYKECKSWHVQSNKVRNLIEELIDFCNSKTIEEGDERTQGLCGGAHCTPDVGGCKPNVNVKFLFIICHQNNALHSMHFMLSALPCPALPCPALPCTALHCTTPSHTAPHRTALPCTALHCTVLHCTALRCAARLTHIHGDGDTKWAHHGLWCMLYLHPWAWGYQVDT